MHGTLRNESQHEPVDHLSASDFNLPSLFFLGEVFLKKPLFWCLERGPKNEGKRALPTPIF